MKVIEEKPWHPQIPCPCCKSTLELEELDVEYGDFGVQYADDHDWQYYVTCAVCKTQIRLKDAILTPRVMENARERSRLGG